MNWHLIWRSDLTYQIKCQFWQQLNWPIWQWSDNWIDQFDNADHITNIAKIDTWFDTSDLIVKSSVNSISKIIISYYEKISNWIDIDLILNWPIWPKQIDTLFWPDPPLIGRPFWPYPPPITKEMKCANAVYWVQENTVLFICIFISYLFWMTLVNFGMLKKSS